MKYNEIVSALKVIARDQLRLVMVINLRTDLNEVDNRKIKAEQDLAEIKLDLARVDFKMSQVHAEDPDREAKLKDLEDTKTELNTLLTRTQEYIDKTLAKEADEINAKIEDVTNGKVKVSAERLEETTKELAKKFIECQACEVAKAANV